jgi:hypothetical protein
MCVHVHIHPRYRRSTCNTLFSAPSSGLYFCMIIFFYILRAGREPARKDKSCMYSGIHTCTHVHTHTHACACFMLRARNLDLQLYGRCLPSRSCPSIVCFLRSCRPRSSRPWQQTHARCVSYSDVQHFPHGHLLLTCVRNVARNCLHYSIPYTCICPLCTRLQHKAIRE